MASGMKLKLKAVIMPLLYYAYYIGVCLLHRGVCRYPSPLQPTHLNPSKQRDADDDGEAGKKNIHPHLKQYYVIIKKNDETFSVMYI